MDDIKLFRMTEGSATELSGYSQRSCFTLRMGISWPCIHNPTAKGQTAATLRRLIAERPRSPLGPCDI